MKMKLSKELRELIKSEAASMHPDSKYEQGQAVLLMKLGAVLAYEEMLRVLNSNPPAMPLPLPPKP